MTDTKKELEKNNLILLVISPKKYSEVMIDIVKQLNKDIGLYVTLNNPYEDLIKTFKEKGIDCNKCFFIDAISAKVKLKNYAKNCVWVSAPNALTELSIAINESIKKIKPKVMIFDSLSTLLIYLPINIITMFTQSLVTKLKESNVQAVFPIIKNNDLIKPISLFMNRVVDFEL